MVKHDLSDLFSLDISDDCMTAHLTISQSEENAVRLVDIQKFLLKENVIAGIQIENVKNFLKHSLYGEEFLIAKGYEPEESIPARLEYLISDKVEQNLEENERGEVDFRDIQIVKMIDKGTPLIRKHPMVLGKPGLNIHNVEIEATPGEDISIPMGSFNVISNMDENLCVSECDGFIKKAHDGKIHVNPTLKVKEDIDFSTGNIDFKGSVVIPGDVKSGFKVEATGDILVHGAVENAKIVSQENVTVKGGFVGLNDGLIQSKKDIRIGYIENQTVYTEGDLYVKSEMLNVKAEAGNSIYAEKGKIIGGRVSAGSKINVFDIGTKEGSYTEVVVGTNTFIIEKMQKIEKAIKDLEQREKNVQERIYDLASKKVNAKEFTEEMQDELNKCKKEKRDIPLLIEDKKEEISSVKGDLESLLDAKINVRGTLYSNVKITIGEKSMTTKENYQRCTVFLEDDVIRIN